MRKTRQLSVKCDDRSEGMFGTYQTAASVSNSEGAIPEADWFDLLLHSNAVLSQTTADLEGSTTKTAYGSQQISPPFDETINNLTFPSSFLPNSRRVPTKLENQSWGIDSIYPPSITDLPSLYVDPSFVETTGSPSQLDKTPSYPIPRLIRSESPLVDVEVARSQTDSNVGQNASHFFARIEYDPNNARSGDAPSFLESGLKSSGNSILTISSLRKRLSLKYSDSYVGDIVSLMHNLTVAGSSAISTNKTVRKARKVLSTFTSNFNAGTTLSPVEEVPQEETDFPSSHKNLHPVTLPGIFPTCCLASNERSQICPCRHGKKSFFSTEDYQRSCLKNPRAVRSDLLVHCMDIRLAKFVMDEIDIFGNSGLHIAASCMLPWKLVELNEEWFPERQGNNANQTFLHLIQEPCPENHMGIATLLVSLREVGFDFNQRDHHGQTALHLLTRPWINKEVLGKFLEIISDWELPPYRDNLGYTIKEQLEQAGLCTNSMRNAATNGEESKYAAESCLPNYETDTAIETIEDLRMYTQHAELIRDVRKSLEDPFYEDALGRNGLHSLAEASLSLALPAKFGAGTPQIQRERYLDGLLDSGVDVNNHDRKGFTPLMAFIIHTRADEGDAHITQLLHFLLDAGAHIDTRNRQGETALQIAVKLGRRAATKFLLRNGANVHARENEGLGIIAIAEAASKKAKRDAELYAQIMLCMSLVVNAGGVSAPTILQEWAS